VTRPVRQVVLIRPYSVAGDYLAVSSVVLFELWGPDVLDFDDQDAQTAGQIRAAPEKSGSLIGAYDLLIAGQALRRGLTVVTANAFEFGRVPGLNWVDWTG
jgi:tRNA(fMet)-specific endonuclease VapC